MKNPFYCGTLLCFVGASSVNADHFNASNLYNECLADPSFDSTCYSYIAGFKDSLGYFLHATDEERARLLCILTASTPETIERMIAPKDTWVDHRTGSYLMLITCGP